VLQCVAVWCSVLQCVALRFRDDAHVLQCGAACCDRNLCQDTCFLSGVQNKIFTHQKARSQADVMNLFSVTIGSIYT